MPQQIEGDLVPVGHERFEGAFPVERSARSMPLNPVGFSRLIQPGEIIEIFRAGSDDEVASPVSFNLGTGPQMDPNGGGPGSFPGNIPVGLGTQGTLPAFLIKWGVGGTRFATEVDAAPGSQFTLVASFVEILGVNLAGNANPIDLRGFITPGVVKGGPDRPHRSYGINADLPVAAALTAAVPPFATRVIAHRAPTAGSFDLRFDGTGGVPTVRNTLISFAAGASMSIPIPIPGWCNNISLVNTSAAPLTGATLEFELDL